LDEPADQLPRHRLAGSPDVLVVGAGVTGCAAALALAEAGVRVRLQDARQVAGGASGRNGGFALRGTAAAYDVAVASLGRERAAQLWHWTEDGVDRLATLAGDAFRRPGSLRLAGDEDERDELRRELEALAADGFSAEWLDELPPPLAGRFPGAILHPRDGVLHPARFVRSLAAAAARAGAEIVEGGRVVVATDGYPSGLLGPLEGMIIPTRAQMIATRPLPDLCFERPHYGRHGFDYWHQRADGRLLLGGFRDVTMTTEFTDVEETTEPIQRALERFAADLADGPIEVTHRWAGIFGFVPDLLPVVGRVPGSDRLWVAGGYSGHGNVLGLLCGDLVAQALLGRQAPFLDLFEPARLIIG
jgi:gamma-glutamylputrescine oxidase